MEKGVERQIRYPFSGVAPNLIDKFLVLGYNQKIIDNTSQKGKVFENFSKYEVIYKKVSEKPSIINEITNDYIKEWLDDEMIIKLIFPNSPSMLLVNKTKMNANALKDMEILIQPRSIIFSINPIDSNGSKRSYNGLGFIFFIPMDHKINDKIVGLLNDLGFSGLIFIISSNLKSFAKIFISFTRNGFSIPKSKLFSKKLKLFCL